MTRGIPFDPSRVIQLTLSPVLVAHSTGGAEQTFTVNGLKTTDVIVSVTKPTTQAGLGIGGARVSAANTLAINFINATGSDITPTASEKYLVTVLRPDSLETDGNIQFR
jgi:hypothetical protein